MRPSLIYAFSWCGIVFLAIGGILLAGWGLVLKGQYGICQIEDRETVGGQCCPWPDDCHDCVCVTIVAYWYPAKHITYLYLYGYGDDCWTSEDPWPLLNKDYKIGENKTCYSPSLDSRNVKFSSSGTEKAERAIFIAGLTCIGIGGMAFLLSLIMYIIYRCYRHSNKIEYEQIN